MIHQNEIKRLTQEIINPKIKGIFERRSLKGAKAAATVSVTINLITDLILTAGFIFQSFQTGSTKRLSILILSSRVVLHSFLYGYMNRIKLNSKLVLFYVYFSAFFFVLIDSDSEAVPSCLSFVTVYSSIHNGMIILRNYPNYLYILTYICYFSAVKAFFSPFGLKFEDLAGLMALCSISIKEYRIAYISKKEMIKSYYLTEDKITQASCLDYLSTGVCIFNLENVFYASSRVIEMMGIRNCQGVLKRLDEIMINVDYVRANSLNPGVENSGSDDVWLKIANSDKDPTPKVILQDAKKEMAKNDKNRVPRRSNLQMFLRKSKAGEKMHKISTESKTNSQEASNKPDGGPNPNTNGIHIGKTFKGKDPIPEPKKKTPVFGRGRYNQKNGWRAMDHKKLFKKKGSRFEGNMKSPHNTKHRGSTRDAGKKVTISLRKYLEQLVLKHQKEGSNLSGGLHKSFNVSIENAKFDGKAYEIFFTRVNFHNKNCFLMGIIDATVKNQKVVLEDANQFKTQILGYISHNLKNPLTGISAFLDTFSNFAVARNLVSIKPKTQASGLMDQQNAQDMSLISNGEGIGSIYLVARQAVEELHQLMNHVQTFTQISSGNLELQIFKFNAEVMLNNIKSKFIKRFEERGIQLIVNVTKLKESMISSSRKRIMQILENLVRNSMKHTLSGYVKLEAETISEKVVKFSVVDTGSGMSKQKMRDLFQMNTTSLVKTYSQVVQENLEKPDGDDHGLGGAQPMGLGLKLCYHLAELLAPSEMDSYFFIDSEPGIGSEVYFFVDVTKQETSPLLNFLKVPSIPGHLKSMMNDMPPQIPRVRSLDHNNRDLKSIIESLRATKKTPRSRLNRTSFKPPHPPELQHSSKFSPMADMKKFQTLGRRSNKQCSVLGSSHGHFSKGSPSPSPGDFGGMHSHKHSHCRIHQAPELKLDKSIILAPQEEEEEEHKCDCFEILVVDDDDFNLLFLEKMLETENYKTQRAINGKQALDKLYSHCPVGHMYGKSCKIVFTDINMPIMNGFELAKQLRRRIKKKELREMTIIGNTANLVEETKPFDDFDESLSKPLKKKQVVGLIQKYLGKYSLGVRANRSLQLDTNQDWLDAGMNGPDLGKLM